MLKLIKDFLKTLFSYQFFKVFIYFIFVFSGSLKWLPIPYDITGVALFFLLIIFIFEMKRFVSFQIKVSSIIILILVLNCMFLISNVYTISTVYAYNKNLAILLNIFTIIYPIVAFKESVFKELNMLLLIIGVLLIASLSFMYFNGLFIIFHNSEFLIEKVPTYLTIGIMLSACFLFSMYYKVSTFILFYRIAILFLLLQLGGRGPILNLIISLFLFYFVIPLNFRINLKLVLSFSVVLLIVLFFLNDFVLNLVENINFERFNLFLAFDSDNSFIARQDFLIKGIESITDNFFFGRGIGSSGLILHGEDSIAYAHNLFLESIMEIGIFAGIIYLLIYFKLFRANIFLIKNDKSLAILFVLCFLFFLEDNKSNSFDSWRISIIWIMFFLSEKRFYIRKSYENGTVVS